MSNIKIKHYQLFKHTANGIEISEKNPALQALLTHKAEGVSLRYDIQRKLSKSIEKALSDFSAEHKSLLEELSTNKKIKLKSGDELETKMEIINATEQSKVDEIIAEIDGTTVKGEKIIGVVYDLGDKKEEFNKRLIELLNLEIELECNPIKLSKLDKEKCLPAEIDFGVLDDFITDDLQ
ncbi:MAG: hypothetical protein HYS25_00860 [Ignavibacteriales bacterium]|nr:hypothetical protein [Ignavibacteriales bacterium]